MRWEIFLLAIIAISSGCAHATSEPPRGDPIINETSELSNLSNDENIVYYTDSGFQPQEITVQQGDSVTWINNASTNMWVGSDRHPTHTNYAGSSLSEHCQNGDQNEAAFDQCSSGDRFSFTFEKTGEWGYHNHLNAGNRGTITVE